MYDVYVHPHATCHGLSEEEILFAWVNFVRRQPRKAPNEDRIVCVGYGMKTATPIQMVAASKDYGVLIYHAMTPPQKSVLRELGLLGGKR